MLLVTLETNVVIDHDRRSPRGYPWNEILFRAHLSGLCELMIATRCCGGVRSESAKRLVGKLPILPARLRTGFRLNWSSLGCGDYLPDEERWRQKEHLVLNIIWPGSTAHSKKHSRRLRDMDNLGAYACTPRSSRYIRESDPGAT